MAFNPNDNYHSVVDHTGKVFMLQHGMWYDGQGHSFTSLPKSSAGFAPPFSPVALSPEQLAVLMTLIGK